MIIDGIRTEFTDEKNILQVIRKAGIHVPTFCYYSDMSIYGACRMCVVEDERGSVIASCSTPPRDKMVIKTNTSKLHQHRKMILELLWHRIAVIVQSVIKMVTAVCRCLRHDSVFRKCVFQIRTRNDALMIRHGPSCVIRVNVSYVVTAFVCVMKYSMSVPLILRSAEPIW